MKNLFDTIWHRVLRRPYLLAVTDTGGPGKVVLLLHGLGTSGEAWRPLVSQLKGEAWRVITLDLLGFGQSPRPEWNSYSVEDHARAVIATLRRLGVRKQKLTLVGHSMGCLVASHIAARRPRRVQRLVLYEPPVFAQVPDFPRHERSRSR